MNTVDWSEYKFRPSGLKNLMTNSRSKSDPLSETTKSYLNEIYIKEVFGREKVISSAAMSKGTAVESDTLELFQKVTGKTYFKNQNKIANDFIAGTPDFIDKSEKLVGDTKSSWDLWTFAKVTEKSAMSDYYWQLTGYAWLTESERMALVYGLVNTPEFIITDELYRLHFKLPPDADTDPYRVNYIFDDIPDAMKIKRFDFVYNPEDVELLKSKILLCRNYLSQMSL